MSRSVFRPADLGDLQCRLYHPGNVGGDFVLQLEDIFQRTIKAVSPEVRFAHRVDQLGGDAHATARFAHRAFRTFRPSQHRNHGSFH